MAFGHYGSPLRNFEEQPASLLFEDLSISSYFVRVTPDHPLLLLSGYLESLANSVSGLSLRQMPFIESLLFQGFPSSAYLASV
jgi:hypothetical protein